VSPFVFGSAQMQHFFGRWTYVTDPFTPKHKLNVVKALSVNAKLVPRTLPRRLDPRLQELGQHSIDFELAYPCDRVVCQIHKINLRKQQASKHLIRKSNFYHMTKSIKKTSFKVEPSLSGCCEDSRKKLSVLILGFHLMAWCCYAAASAAASAAAVASAAAAAAAAAVVPC
jgi:hypothetical protein